MSRRWVIAVAVVIVLVVAAAVPASVLFLRHRRDAAQRTAAEDFASAWRGGKLATLTYANSDGTTAGGAIAAAAVQKVTAGLTSATRDSPATVAVTSVKQDGKDAATAGLKVGWTLTGNLVWSYATSLELVKVGASWLPEYQTSVVHPGLATGTLLRTSIQEPTRGEIIGDNGQALVTERPVVTVGLERARATDVASTVSQVASITGVDSGALLKRVNAASATSFVQVIVLRKAAYEKVRRRLQPIPGAVFQTGTLALAPTSTFARALIGTVGPATADAVKASKGRVQAGEQTGLSGLQQAYDEQLGGTPGLVVQAVRSASPSSSSSSSAFSSTMTVTLFSVPAVNGKALHVTLDEKVQEAAEKALTHATKPAAIVAVQPGTGAVLAVANGGPNAAGYDRALLGQYPPGSTFKVATTKALLGAGITPNTTVNCPSTVTVGGRTFKNAESEKFGAVKFRLDFANSCNTAFIGSSSKITQAQLAAAAKSLGYGQPNQLGITAFTGQVPSGGDAVSHAASMIGQSTILTSPVTVAGASAAVASGAWNAPRLVLDGTEKLTTNGPDSIAISKSQDATLKSLMRDVVTEGTATGLRSTPGGTVYGKTGTAEFGNADPPQTHAWFTGWQGDVAFACVVEDGGFGAKAAAPLIKDFLTTLATPPT